MFFLQLCLAGLAGFGLWLVLTDTILFPTLRTEMLYRENERKKSGGNWMDQLAAPLAKRLEPHLSLNEYKREKLNHTLKTIGDSKTAEQYTANAAAQSLILAAIGLTTGLVYPLLPVIVTGLAVYSYLKSMREPEKRLKEKREKIELELPRLASTISNSLSASRDVVKMLEHYRKVCGAELADELDVTLADMKTGNQQNALRGLENRIGSTQLSELVRGLLSVLRGEDQQLYFYTKNIEFRRDSIEHQKQEIQKRPDKLMPYIVGIMFCFVVMLVYILGCQVMQGERIFL